MGNARRKVERRAGETEGESGTRNSELGSASSGSSPAPRLSPPASRPSPLSIECPFCHGEEVELFSLFGSQLLTSEYYCRHCRTVFEQLK